MIDGDGYDRAMKITDQAEADAHFALLVEESLVVFKKSRAETEQNVRDSLGYWAGYHSHETRERVERLFKCAHPISDRSQRTALRRPSKRLMPASRGLSGIRGRMDRHWTTYVVAVGAVLTRMDDHAWYAEDCGCFRICNFGVSASFAATTRSSRCFSARMA